MLWAQSPANVAKMDHEDTIKVFKFNGMDETFKLWTMRLKSVLEEKDLMEIVGGEEAEPDSVNVAELAAFTKRKRKSLAILINALGDKPLMVVSEVSENPSLMWKRLHKRYGDATTATLIEAQTELHTKKYRGNEDMSEYVDSFERMFDRLANMKSKVEETVKIAIFLA